MPLQKGVCALGVSLGRSAGEVRGLEAGSRVGLAASPKERELGSRGRIENVQKLWINLHKMFASGFSLFATGDGGQLAWVLLGCLWPDTLD